MKKDEIVELLVEKLREMQVINATQDELYVTLCIIDFLEKQGLLIRIFDSECSECSECSPPRYRYVKGRVILK